MLGSISHIPDPSADACALQRIMLHSCGRCSMQQKRRFCEGATPRITIFADAADADILLSDASKTGQYQGHE